MFTTSTFSTPASNTDVITQNLQNIHHACFIIKSMHNPTRQDIMSNLLKGGSFSVYELCDLLDVEQSMMSQHLGILRKANLVITRRQGKHIYYSMNENKLLVMMQYIRNMAE